MHNEKHAIVAAVSCKSMLLPVPVNHRYGLDSPQIPLVHDASNTVNVQLKTPARKALREQTAVTLPATLPNNDQPPAAACSLSAGYSAVPLEYFAGCL